jgi:type I restriction enzyme, S subunit
MIETVPFIDAVSSRGSGSKGLPQSDWKSDGRFPVIGQGAEYIEGRSDRSDLLLTPAPAVVLYGGHTRRAKLVTEPFIPGPNVKILTPGPRVYAAYLYRFLEQLQIESRGYADHFPEVKRSTIPLPPLAEQKRIAGILDAADGLRAKRRETLAQLDTLLQSTFLDMFGDPVTNPMGWARSRIGDLGDVITGNTPARKCSEYYGDAIEWIKSDNINDPSFTLTNAEEGLSQQGKRIARIAPKGSVLVTCIAGSRSCIGNAAIADREVAFNQQINAFVPGKRILLWYAFGIFLMGKDLVQRASTNSMKGMVSKSAFAGITIPLPPLDLQHRFAAIVESVERQKALMRAHLAELEALFASLQSRAFTGTL